MSINMKLKLFLRKFLFATIILTLHTTTSFARIPEVLRTHLNMLRSQPYSNMPREFRKEQIDLIVDKLRDHLEDTFKELIKKTADYDSDELLNELKSIYRPPDNPEIASPSAQVKEALETILYPLIVRYKGKTIGDTLFINYKGYWIPLTISVDANPFTEKTKIQITIEGYALKSDDCARLEINPIKKTARLNWLQTQGVICPIPKGKEGTFLLSLVENIAKTMRLKSIFLQDHSEIQCKENSKRIQFQLLRLIQTAKGWYESKGYRHRYPEFQEDFDMEVNQFLHYKLKHFLAEISNPTILNSVNAWLRSPPIKASTIELAKEKARAFLDEEPNANFSAFMNHIYDTSCALYTEFEEAFLHQGSNKVFTIEKLIPNRNELLEKKLQ